MRTGRRNRTASAAALQPWWAPAEARTGRRPTSQLIRENPELIRENPEGI